MFMYIFIAIAVLDTIAILSLLCINYMMIKDMDYLRRRIEQAESKAELARSTAYNARRRMDD